MPFFTICYISPTICSLYLSTPYPLSIYYPLIGLIDFAPGLPQYNGFGRGDRSAGITFVVKNFYAGNASTSSFTFRRVGTVIRSFIPCQVSAKYLLQFLSQRIDISINSFEIMLFLPLFLLHTNKETTCYLPIYSNWRVS